MKARLIFLGVVVAVAVTMAPVAWAGSHRATTRVSGGWSWVNVSSTETTLTGGNKLFAGDEIGTWTGTFKGTSYDTFAMTLTPPFDWDNNDYGPAWGTLMSYYTGTVAGKKGSMVVFFTIEEPADDPVMVGHWVIMCGTEGLANLRGSGTWVSSGVDSSATYKGRIAWK